MPPRAPNSKVYTRPDAGSAWTEWPAISRDTARNTVTALGLGGFGHLAVGESTANGGEYSIYLPVVDK